MTASTREWTKADLDEVWPVPGWTWGHVSGSVWALYCDAEPGQFVCMSVLGRMILPSHGGVPPVAALLAVIGQHEGRDSPETLAAEIAARADAEYERGIVWTKDSPADVAYECGHSVGREEALREVAEMVRRGTVKS